MEHMIRNLDECNPKKEKIKAQREMALLNARKFYKGRRMILISFENGSFPLPRQYPLDMNDWKEDELDLSHILADESDSLLSSAERRKKETELRIVLVNIYRGKYNTYDELDNFLFKTKRYLNFDLVQKYFNYNSLEEMLRKLDKTKDTYMNEVKVTLIKSGLRDFKNRMK